MKFHLKSILYCCVISLLLVVACQKDEPEDNRTIIEKLQDLPGVTVTEIDPPYFHTQAFRLDITQHLDQFNESSPTFTQEVYLHHVDESLPMVFGPSGYGVSASSRQELVDILQCNMATVTYRFFDGSKPEPYDWQYLTVEQAAADHHHIFDLLDDIYQGVWISSGASKSGQTVCIHKRFYPDDVDATVAYVAPFVFGTRDERFINFLNQLGTAECREKLENFERRALLNRDSLQERFEQYFPANGFVLSLDPDIAYEYFLLEYHFAFWQFHNHDCSTIPDEGASYDEMFAHLRDVTWINTFADSYLDYYEPYVYQALSEIGYPSYLTEHLKDLLIYAPDPGAEFYIVSDISPTYDVTVINDIYHWLQTEGDNIIYIYGEIDPWSAGMIELTGETNAIRVIQPGADHSVRIVNLDEKDLVIETLEEWLKIEINY
jgi:hypothetical protein